MASKVKKPEEQKHHEVASFLFLPFVVDLFSRRDLRMKRAELLPVGEPKSLTLEVVEAVEDIVVCGTVGFLCRSGGWRALSYAQPGKEEPNKNTRLIDETVWLKKKLKYSKASLETLLITYNAVCQAGGQPYPGDSNRKKTKKNKLYPKTKTFKFSRNGDILVHHLAFLNIRAAPFKVEDAYWRFLVKNPLTQVARLATTEDDAKKVFDRLNSKDMGMMLPWLGFHLSSCWQRELETRWDSLNRFHRLNTGMSSYFNHLLDFADREERRDVLVCLMHFFKAHFERPGIEDLWFKEFNRLARDLRFADRTDYQRMWASALNAAWRLNHQYGEARSVHPIDREAPDRVFMEAYEALDFEETAYRIHQIANQLNSVIS